MQNAYNPKPITAVTTNSCGDGALQIMTKKTKLQNKRPLWLTRMPITLASY